MRRGGVGLSGPERANRFCYGCDMKRHIKHSPAATAPDPPARVLKLHTSSTGGAAQPMPGSTGPGNRCAF